MHIFCNHAPHLRLLHHLAENTYFHVQSSARDASFTPSPLIRSDILSPGSEQRPFTQEPSQGREQVALKLVRPLRDVRFPVFEKLVGRGAETLTGERPTNERGTLALLNFSHPFL